MPLYSDTSFSTKPVGSILCECVEQGGGGWGGWVGGGGRVWGEMCDGGY